MGGLCHGEEMKLNEIRDEMSGCKEAPDGSTLFWTLLHGLREAAGAGDRI